MSLSTGHQRRSTPGLRLALLLGFVSLFPLGAARAEGQGLLVADSARLHLILDTELRYDSLAAQGALSGDSNVQNPADFILHVRPGLRLVSAGSKVDFTGTAGLDWSKFTGWISSGTNSLSYLGARAELLADINKEGPFLFQLGDLFLRSDQINNPALNIGTISNSNLLHARGTWRPGGGAIEASLGYSFGLDTYGVRALGPNCDPATGKDKTTGQVCDPSQEGSQTHRMLIEGKWRFLPKTAVLLDASWSLRSYNSDTVNVPSKPLRVEAALAGLVSERLRVTLKAGFVDVMTGSLAGVTTSNKIGPVATAEVGWLPLETAGLTVGVLYSIEPVSTLSAWYDDIRGYLSGRLQLGGKFIVTGTASVDRLGFGDYTTTGVGAGTFSRADVVSSLALSGDLELLRLVHVVPGFVLSSRDSTLSANAIAGSGGTPNFSRAEVYVRVVVSY